MQTWNQTIARFKPGRIVGPDSNPEAYRIVSTDEKRIRLERIATGSPVAISRKMIEGAAARLDSGAFIERRSISYTVAIETLVILALGSSVEEHTVDGVRGYRAATA